MESQSSMRVKLIFNPSSGANVESPVEIADVLKEMQTWKFLPELYLIDPDSDLPGVVEDAISQGIQMFVVCGGDGTISAVTKALMGTNAILGIIPAGTQNNVALSLGIPTDIPGAVAILGKGQPLKIDIGLVTCNDISTPFIELCSVGLFSTLFPSGDDIQHGNIARIGDFLGILTTSPPSDIHLLLDDNKEIHKFGHAALISNMPYIGRHYQVGAPDAYNDGLLDVLFFADLSKLDLIGYILNGVGTDTPEDPRIQHYRVRRVVIDTQPAMPVMADGITLGEGKVLIEVTRHALTVMVGTTESDELV
ncbi:diacylglycerol/lipid kinase family protein [Acetobacterium sp.]|uniref:diacylglycerol/lipid kinase family protein n=1 Tax=Acetobacterium sp. TaxID=1872094 RepID=UPI002F3E7501